MEPTALKVLTLGAALLRNRCLPVTDALSLARRKLFYDTVFTGVGQSDRFFVMRDYASLSRELTSQEEHSEIPFNLVINPSILWSASDLVGDYEMCLSIPNMIGYVFRASEIDVEYETVTSATKTETVRARLSGTAARVFQHENDHLDGILYPDRIRKADEKVGGARAAAAQLFMPFPEYCFYYNKLRDLRDRGLLGELHRQRDAAARDPALLEGLSQELLEKLQLVDSELRFDTATELMRWSEADVQRALEGPRAAPERP